MAFAKSRKITDQRMIVILFGKCRTCRQQSNNRLEFGHVQPASLQKLVVLAKPCCCPYTIIHSAFNS